MILIKKNLEAYKTACKMLNYYEDLRTEFGSRGMRLDFRPFYNTYVIAPSCYRIKRWFRPETILKKLEAKLQTGHAYDHWPWDTELDQLIARLAKESWNEAYHQLIS